MIASDNTHDHAGHDHQHGHGHGGHGHSHAPSSFGRAFAIGTALNLTFVVVEAVYGLIAGSMALLADAGHNLSDVLGLLIAWSAMALARRKPSGRYTYGLRSSSILAALFNAVLLLVADVIGRLVARPSTIEVGVVVAVIGAPVLIALVRRTKAVAL